MNKYYNDYDDNIIKGIQGWDAPYRFIIGRRSKENLSDVEVMLWTPLPALAYQAYIRIKDVAEFNDDDEVTWNYFLEDSFHKDAEMFCRTAWENDDEFEDFEDY